MTIHQFPGSRDQSPGPRRSTPSRSGEPWADEDYTTLLRLAREDAPVEEVCRTLGRSRTAVQHRAKRLLPLDQRGTPGDRVLQHLGELARADEHYPWATHLAATPPPRPIVQHVHPAPLYAGVSGLDNRELVAAATTLALSPTTASTSDLARQVAVAVVDRNLTNRLWKATEDRTLELAGAFVELAGGRWGGKYREEVAWDHTYDEPPAYEPPTYDEPAYEPPSRWRRTEEEPPA